MCVCVCVFLNQVPIIQYFAQHSRLVPSLAATYAYTFLSQKVKTAFDRPAANHEEARQLRVLISAFKVGASTYSFESLQNARECCGAQGFAGSNLLSALRDCADAYLTWDGDNSVLLAQVVARELLRDHHRKISQPRGLVAGTLYNAYSALRSEIVDHLEALRQALSFLSLNFGSALRQPEFHMKVFLAREEKMMQSLSTSMQRELDRSNPHTRSFLFYLLGVRDHHDDDESTPELKLIEFDIWNRYQREALALARAHVDRVALQRFHEVIQRSKDESRSRKKGTTLLLLEKLASVFALRVMECDKWFVAEQLVSPMQLQMVECEIEMLCREICCDDGGDDGNSRLRVLEEAIAGLAVEQTLWRDTVVATAAAAANQNAVLMSSL